MKPELEEHAPDVNSSFQSLVGKFKYQTPSSPSPSLLRRSSRTPKQAVDSKPEHDDDVLPTVDAEPRARKERKRHAPSPSRERTGSISPKKLKRGYAPPETYAHLDPLSDHLEDELDVMMCGINPGHDSAKYGYHYAHRSNHFWRCLHLSGLTARLHPPSDGHLLPKEYSIGLTNLIERPSAEAAEIDKEEFLTAVPAFLAKVCARRPRIVCFVGKVVWDAVQRVFKASAPKAREARFIWGLQPYKLVHDTGCVSETLFFVVPSTSARVVSHQLDDKVKLFTLLKTILESVKANTLDTASFAIVGVA